VKRGQLAAVIIIVLLVAAIGGFIIFSEKRAGEAARTLAAAKQQSYPRYTQPPSITRPPAMAELQKVDCEDICESDDHCPVGCSVCKEYYFSGVKRCQRTEKEERTAVEELARAEFVRKIKEEVAVLMENPDKWLSQYCYPRCDDKLKTCLAQADALEARGESAELVSGYKDLCEKEKAQCRKNCEEIAGKARSPK